MKTSDKPTQILNVTSTISQLQRHQLRRPIYQVRQTKSMDAKIHQASRPKYQIHQSKNQIHKQKTKYAKIHQVGQTKDKVRQTKSMHTKYAKKTTNTPTKTSIHDIAVEI